MREYRNNDHLSTTIDTECGPIGLVLNRAADVHFRAAWGDQTAPLDIGRGVLVGVTGNVGRTEAGWAVTHMSVSRHDRCDLEVSPTQRDRAREAVRMAVVRWAGDHEAELAEAEFIDRNNAARTLEMEMERHQEALMILRRELKRCECGKPFSRYPDLPTKR